MTNLLDAAYTEMTLVQLLDHYNELAVALGHDRRNSTFRDRPTALKRVEGLLVEIRSLRSPDTDDEPAPTPREKTVQRLAAKVIAKTKPAKDPATKTRSRIPLTAKIYVLTPDRKVRPGTEAEPMWAAYRNGMTVADYIKKTANVIVRPHGNPAPARNYLAFDARKGYIKIENVE